jgi:hypothetical protein
MKGVIGFEFCYIAGDKFNLEMVVNMKTAQHTKHNVSFAIAVAFI